MIRMCYKQPKISYASSGWTSAFLVHSLTPQPHCQGSWLLGEGDRLLQEICPPILNKQEDGMKQINHMNLQSSTAAAAAAKSLQSCPTLCGPIDGSPPGSPIPGILQARTVEWIAISFSNAYKAAQIPLNGKCLPFFKKLY